MNTNILNVSDLDLKQNSFILILWKRNSGKTILTRNIIYELIQKNDYDFILLFWETANFNKDYSFINEKYIFKFSELNKKIWKLLKIQEER